MDLRIFTEPQQGATYADLLRVARAAEDAGYDAFFRSDHYLAMAGDGGAGPTDAWTTLAGLAVQTSTITLGTLVTSATFRLPGVLAVIVAQVQQMSGGRVELGLGTGWFEGEHTAFGIPFPPLKERFDRLEEQLQILEAAWSGPFTHTGTHYRLTDNPALARADVPVIVGGSGAKRTPALAARYADEFNIPFQSLRATAEAFGRVTEACAVTGRTLRYSAAQVLCVGRDDAEVARRAAAIGREVAELKENGLAGTPAEVVEKVGSFTAEGASRMYLQLLDLTDLDHLELVASEVMPHV